MSSILFILLSLAAPIASVETTTIRVPLCGFLTTNNTFRSNPTGSLLSQTSSSATPSETNFKKYTAIGNSNAAGDGNYTAIANDPNQLCRRTQAGYPYQFYNTTDNRSINLTSSPAQELKSLMWKHKFAPGTAALNSLLSDGILDNRI